MQLRGHWTMDLSRWWPLLRLSLILLRNLRPLMMVLFFGPTLKMLYKNTPACKAALTRGHRLHSSIHLCCYGHSCDFIIHRLRLGRWLSGDECFLLKHEDMSSNSQHPHEKWPWLHIPVTTELGDREKQISCPPSLKEKFQVQ